MSPITNVTALHSTTNSAQTCEKERPPSEYQVHSEGQHRMNSPMSHVSLEGSAGCKVHWGEMIAIMHNKKPSDWKTELIEYKHRGDACVWSCIIFAVSVMIPVC